MTHPTMWDNQNFMLIQVVYIWDFVEIIGTYTYDYQHVPTEFSDIWRYTLIID